ncbi:MAG: MauE/DoxX family redox-associated membrane protein [Desulfosporosinus sp.]|nr:MauE/DoxX family redox-associated membrane protein [Desulfosporosinus sp.]
MRSTKIFLEKQWDKLILKLLLAGLYVFAGGSKIFNLYLYKATILAYYSFLPEILALVIAIVFPWVEILVGLALVLNWKTKYFSCFLFGLSLFFFIQIILNYSNILPYGCGCFGFGGPEKIGYYYIFRDFFILVLAGFVSIKEWKQ